MKIDIQKLLFAARRMRIITLPARLEIIKIISENEKINVTQIVSMVNMKQAETSAHLILLEQYGILNKTRIGRESFYSLNQEGMDEIIRISEELSKFN